MIRGMYLDERTNWAHDNTVPNPAIAKYTVKRSATAVFGRLERAEDKDTSSADRPNAAENMIAARNEQTRGP